MITHFDSRRKNWTTKDGKSKTHKFNWVWIRLIICFMYFIFAKIKFISIILRKYEYLNNWKRVERPGLIQSPWILYFLQVHTYIPYPWKIILNRNILLGPYWGILTLCLSLESELILLKYSWGCLSVLELKLGGHTLWPQSLKVLNI